MEISRNEALKILEIEDGCSNDEIRIAYKKQALRWHPDKHKNSPEATKKFQEISAAYERLTKPQELEIHLTMDEMFDLFAHVFFGSRGQGAAYSNGFFFDESDSDSDQSGYTYEHTYEHTYEPYREKQSRERDIPRSSRPTVSEAQRNEEELLREEEKQKKQKEKRRERKKRRKAKKRQEKEVRYGGGDGKKKGKKEAVPESSDDEVDQEEDENKENVQLNSAYGETNTDLNTETSSRGSKVLDSNSNSHKQGDDSHRKEVHDGHQGEEGGGGDAAKMKMKNKKPGNSVNVHDKTMSDSESNEETQGLDVNSAFFARAAGGKAKKQTTLPTSKTKKKAKGKKEESESLEDMDPQILESRKFAVKGNEMANKGNYQAAVKFFTKAIELNPMDFRFFGNRSFCFDHLQSYDSALQDAEKAISLDKTWPKGYYRKGRALTGLKLFSDAESAFEQVLKLDKNCVEAIQELRTVRVYRLMEMGFSAQKSEAAIQQYNTVQAALENLLSQGGMPENGEIEEVYISDEEDYITQTIQESKLDSKNPENLRSLWIGNLQPTVTEKELRDLFKQYGEVTSMRRMTEKFCAFINYKDPRMASNAMEKLQGCELHGKYLLIKFPDNPIDHHIQTQGKNSQEYVDLRYKTMILRKNPGQTSTATKGKQQQQQQLQQLSKKQQQQHQQAMQNQQDQLSKVTGPVNGDECFFWRTTGCWYGERCHYKHLPQSKGVDRK